MPRKDPELEEAQPESGSTPEPTLARRAEVPDIKSTGRSALLSQHDICYRLHNSSALPATTKSVRLIRDRRY